VLISKFDYFRILALNEYLFAFDSKINLIPVITRCNRKIFVLFNIKPGLPGKPWFFSRFISYFYDILSIPLYLNLAAVIVPGTAAVSSWVSISSGYASPLGQVSLPILAYPALLHLSG
jgi:hypothetical protein